jgi:hypothetical protein
MHFPALLILQAILHIRQSDSAYPCILGIVLTVLSLLTSEEVIFIGFYESIKALQTTLRLKIVGFVLTVAAELTSHMANLGRLCSYSYNSANQPYAKSK